MKTFSCLFLFILFSTKVFSQVPETVNFQGVLTDSDGEFVTDGYHIINFKIFDSENDGNLMWTETQTISTVNGLLNVVLGKNDNLSLTFDRPYWLELNIDEGEPLLPRVELTSVFYSLRAKTVEEGDNLGDHTAEQNLKLSNHWLSNTGENDGVFVNTLGDVGIGTDTPVSKLDANGTITVSGTNINELNRSQTGNANLVPIAYGTIGKDGQIYSGSTDNFSVTLIETGTYEISITGESFYFTNYVVSCSVYGSSLGFITYYDIGTVLRIRTYDSLGNAINNYFNFIVYKK